MIQVAPLSPEDTHFDHGNVLRIEVTSQLSPVLKERSELKDHEKITWIIDRDSIQVCR